ncbi:LPXTG cell wall anchor domain-containing protein, partial [Demequina sp. NBRC 110053]|uniref:LPXTG cell wall anchor domain-containing protein n=1 Tax=Demequina sp. NBRC 110053 TaxID=1570342 RepID=UPI0013567112
QTPTTPSTTTAVRTPHATPDQPTVKSGTTTHQPTGPTHLSHTGADSWGWAAGAAGLLTLGAGLVIASRRRTLED